MILVIAPAFAATTATRSATSATSKATATWALFAWTGKIYSERAPAEILAMKHGDRTLGFIRRRHLDKAEALRASTCTILDHLRRLHSACLREQALQICITYSERQIANIKFRFHRSSHLLSVGHVTQHLRGKTDQLCMYPGITDTQVPRSGTIPSDCRTTIHPCNFNSIVAQEGLRD